MRREGLGFQLGMKLHADEPRMVRIFHDLGQHPIGRHAGEAQACCLQTLAIGDIHLKAVAMPFLDAGRSIDAANQRILGQHGGIGAQAHGAAKVAAGIARLALIAAHPIGHQPHHRLGAGAEFGAGGGGDVQQVPRRLDDGHLHAEADPQEGDFSLAREPHGLNFAARAALTKAAGHQDAVHPIQAPDNFVLLALEEFAIHPIQLHPHLVGDAAMRQRLVQRFIGVQQPGVLAHHRDRDLALGRGDAVLDALPGGHVRLAINGKVEVPQHLAVQPFLVVAAGHCVDAAGVIGRDHAFGPNVAEQRDLAALILGDFPVAAAEKNLGLDADAEQLLHGMLRRLGLQLAGRGNIGHQRQMHEEAARLAQLIGELPDRFEEGQALNVTDGAAHLDQHEIILVGVGDDRFLDGVGDMRNHLDGGTEIIAAPFLGDHLGIEPPRGPVVRLVGVLTGEALVMAEVEVGLGPVIRDEDLPMLIGRHRARIDVEVGVQLAQPNAVAACLQEGAQGRRRDPLAQRRNHATGDEYKPCHGSPS